MLDRGSLLLRLALTGAAVFAIAPAAASAALTSSSIDSPADGSLLRYDDASGPTTVHVTGTASPPGSTVDIVCISGTNGVKELGGAADNVPTDATTGHFEVDATPPIGEVCRLRAIEDGNNPPSNLTPFTGPKVTVSGLKSFGVDIGSNAGAATDYYIASLLFSAGNDFDSLGGCGLTDSYVFDSTLAFISVFYCNAFTPVTDKRDGAASVEVDGHPSYTPSGVNDGGDRFFSAFRDRAPFPQLGYSYHFDPSTHDLTIHETDHLVRCKPNAETFPPTAASCTSFADAGVKLDRTIVADHGQRLVRFLDRWSSTDGHAHLFTTHYENEHCLVRGECEMHTGFRFPADVAYTIRPNGTSIAGPSRAPGSIFVKDPAAPDGSSDRAQGATVYSVAPDSTYFFRVNPDGSGYVLDYLDRFVPAKGSLDFRFGYATALTTAAVKGFARQLEDQYAAPRVTIGSPVNGDSTADASVLVKGRATDTVGVKSFTLNGRPLALGPGGRFSKRVTLKAGKNTFTAVARDAAGNTGRAQSTIVELLAKTRKAGAKRGQHGVVVDSGQALACPLGGRACTAKLAAAGKPGKVGTATVKAAAGKRGALKFTLNSKGESALDAQKHLRITLKIDIRIGKVGHVKTTRSFDVQRPA